MTGRKQFIAIPSSQMIALSDESYSKVLEENQLSTNSQYVNRVKIVGERLSRAVESYLKQQNQEAFVKDYDWKYNVIVSEELNAWCMPGGQIAFYEGILPVCKDENGIAVVMGHEIAHTRVKPMNWDSISWPWLDMIQELHLISGNEWRLRADHVHLNFYPRIQIPPIELRI